MPSENRRVYLKELLLNQIWQSANFVAKAVFLVALTPLMIWKWGAYGYGLYALASSLLVSMALLDGGVRALTRMRLAESESRQDEDAFLRHYWDGLFAFASVCALAVAAVAGLAATGLLDRWLNLHAGGAGVLFLTTAMTAVFMLTTLALEPLAAQGHLSALKAANTWGALLALPLTAATVYFGGSVSLALVVYFMSITIPNGVLLVRSGLAARLWKGGLRSFHPGRVVRTLRDGFWYYLTTVSLVGKTHGLTFVVSALAGPAEAGLFYILLRITEVVGNVGATASETSLAALAAAKTPEGRRDCFRQSWLYTGVLCLHGAVATALLGESLLKFWLPGKHEIPLGIGVAMAVFGLTGAFSRVIVNAGMGLGLVRNASLGNFLEAVADVVGALVGYRIGGLPGLFVGGSVGVLFLLWPARQIAAACAAGSLALYGASLVPLLPGMLVAGLAEGLAGLTKWPVVWIASGGIAGVIAFVQLRRLHRPAEH